MKKKILFIVFMLSLHILNAHSKSLYIEESIDSLTFVYVDSLICEQGACHLYDFSLLSSLDSVKKSIKEINDKLLDIKAQKNRIIRVRDTVFIKNESIIQEQHEHNMFIDSVLHDVNIQLALMQSEINNSKFVGIIKWGVFTIVGMLIIIMVFLLIMYINIRNYKKYTEVLHSELKDNNGKTYSLISEKASFIEGLIDKLGITINDGFEIIKHESLHKSDLNVISSKPTLEAYNNSVYEFITINDHIASLKRKETKELLNCMFAFLSMHDDDSESLLIKVRESNIPDDQKRQFVSLVSQIQAFLENKKSVINNWLSVESKNGAQDYISCLRYPLGLMYDKELDRDILGEDITGYPIKWVHKLGYYFPGCTIQPYREKSLVEI